MSEKVLDLYTSILTNLGFDITPDGVIKTIIGEDKSQFLVDGKPCLMPTFANLRKPDNKEFFHPLREDMVGGESKLITAMRRFIVLRANVILSSIALDLFNIAASPTLQKALTAEQSGLTTGIGEVDEGSVKKLMTIVAAMAKQDPYKSFVSMYSRRGGSIDGKNYKRICVVSFPLYDELLKDEPKVFGVKVSEKNRAAILSLLRFMFPGIEDDDMYSSGSNSKVAPFFDSLINSTLKIYSSINDLLDVYGSRIDSIDIPRGDFSWVADFEKIDKMTKDILMIPQQGETEIERPQVAPPVPQPAQQSVLPQAPSAMMPYQQVVATPTPIPGQSALGSLISRNPQTAMAMSHANMPYMPGVAPMSNMRTPPTWAMPGGPMSPGVPAQPMGMGMAMGYPNPNQNRW